jgi:hypothetical protein
MAERESAEPIEGRLVAIVSGGFSELVPVEDGYELRIYADYQDAIDQGLAPDLARAMFQRGPRKDEKCSGGCSRQDTQNAKGVWCQNTSCSPSPCDCHLIEYSKGKDGNVVETDLGTDYTKTAPYIKKGKGYTYGCRCKE